jgi:hypothetical protein
MLLELLGTLRLELEPLRTQLYRPPVTVRDRAVWDGVDPEVRRYWIERGARHLDFAWPALSAEMYAEYARTGERAAYEAPYHRRRQAIATLLLAEGFENRGRFVGTLLEGLQRILEEPTWVLPAHHNEVIDIFSAETANLLAWTLYVLEPDSAAARLRPEIDRALRERLIDPYLGRTDFWWMGNGSQRVGNWTTWCTSNCIGVVLLAERAPDRRWRALEKACRSLDLFLEASGEDGGCDEGPTYWNFAAGCLFDSLEMLHQASGGAFDVFAHPAIERLGQYICKVHVHDLHFVNFADSPPEVPVDAALVYRFGKRIGDPQMQALGAHLYRLLEQREPEKNLRLKTSRALATLADESALRSLPAPSRARRQAYLAKLQVMVAREQEQPGSGLLLAAKGGRNDEGHNHNDVGNVVIYHDGRPVIIDAGMKQYTRDSFSQRRYEIWAMRSDYHNVPLVNGFAQEHGPQFAARDARFLEERSSVGFVADIAGAYPAAAGLTLWERRVTLSRDDGQIRIEESYVFDRRENSFELRYMSCCRPSYDGEWVRFEIGPGRFLALEVAPAPGRVTLHAFALHDRNMVHAWGKTLYQVRLLFDGVPSRGGVVTLISLASGIVKAEFEAPLLAGELP